MISDDPSRKHFPSARRGSWRDLFARRRTLTDIELLVIAVLVAALLTFLVYNLATAIPVEGRPV